MVVRGRVLLRERLRESGRHPPMHPSWSCSLSMLFRTSRLYSSRSRSLCCVFFAPDARRMVERLVVTVARL